MSPHIEEAWRALGLADRDIHAFHVLKNDPDRHLSVVCFHAHQAIEKSLKAVLFSRRIEFKRTHNLTELTSLLGAFAKIGKIGTDTIIVTIRGVRGHDRACYGLPELLHHAPRIM